MNIRKIVKTRLKSLGLSQYWLAQQIGMTRQGVGAYLLGRNDMNATTLGKVLDVLDLRLIGGDVIEKLKADKERKRNG